jgi:hypothetical protein
MFNPLLESVMSRIDQNLAIYAFANIQYQFHPQKN